MQTIQLAPEERRFVNIRTEEVDNRPPPTRYVGSHNWVMDQQTDNAITRALGYGLSKKIINYIRRPDPESLENNVLCCINSSNVFQPTYSAGHDYVTEEELDDLVRDIWFYEDWSEAVESNEVNHLTYGTLYECGEITEGEWESHTEEYITESKWLAEIKSHLSVTQ